MPENTESQERARLNRGHNLYWVFEEGVVVLRPYFLALLVTFALIVLGGMIVNGLALTGWLGLTG